MKKSYFLLPLLFAFTFFCSLGLYGQNLVLNPSFETVNTANLKCSWYLTNTEFTNAISNWTMPTGGSTDIFHSSLATSCFCSPFSTDASSPGTQAPRTGNSMSAVFVYGSGGCTPYREYLQGELSSPLVPGQQYCIEFYVSLADLSTYACNNLGVYFTTAPFYNSSMCVYSATPQVNYIGIITNKTAWTLISLSFTPTQAFTHFTIGNFYSDAATSTTNVGGTKTQTRYFLDDVDIHLCNTMTVTVNSPTICAGQTATLNATSNLAGTNFTWSTGATGATINVSPTTTTSYTVTGTASGGVTASAVATVNVNPLPSVSAGALPSAVCNGQCTNLSANGASSYTWMPGNLTGATVNVCPTTNTTYSVTGTTTAGCSASSQLTVTVNPIPVLSASASPANICASQCSNLSVNGASTYTWMPGNLNGSLINVCPTSSTTYTVTGTTTAGCSATSTATVTVNANPVITVAASPAAICSGQCTNLSANGASTYTWMPGNLTGATVNVCPTTNTTYSVTGTTTAGCSASSQLTVTVNPIPVLSASASPANICASQCSNLSVNGASTYTWMPGNLNGSLINVCPTSSTTYTVTGTTTAGCSATSTATVTVNANPVITVAASPAAICSGQCTNLSANGASTYTWMPGNLTGATVNVCPTTNTTYSVTGTTTAGCSASSQLTVTVNPIPVLSASASPASICAGQCTDLSANGASTYTWMPGNLTGSLVNVCPTSSTAYTLTGTTATGCSSSTVVTVNVNPVPVITATASPATLCLGGCTNLNASGADNYSWMPGNLAGYTINVCPNITTTYTVTGSSLQGCSSTNEVTVNVAIAPIVTAVATPANICQGLCTVINGSGADSYLWQPGGLTGASINVCPTATTVYSVTGISPEGCSATATATVTVTPMPVVFASTSNDTLCFGEPTNLYASGAQNFQWQPGGMTGAYVIVYPDATTTYTVTGDVNGCQGTVQVTINVYPYPDITFDADRKEGCEDLLVQFTDQSNFDDASWYWEFGDNTFSYEQNPLHYFNDQGVYNVSLTMTTIYGCTSTFLWPDMITVYKTPEAEFVFAPEFPTELSPTVWFYDRSFGASAWEWDFGDYNALINNSNEQNPIYQYSDTGYYDVMLIAISPMGCADTTRHTVYIAPEVAFFVPNAFTPNDDDRNSNFIGKGKNIRWETFEMRIYDRWGKQILYTQDWQQGWNGKFNGKDMPQDVYVWLISFIDTAMQKHNLKGTVTLVR